jgi:hypothetical protein
MKRSVVVLAKRIASWEQVLDLSVRLTLIITRPQPPPRKTKPHASGRVHDDVRRGQQPIGISQMTVISGGMRIRNYIRENQC